MLDTACSWYLTRAVHLNGTSISQIAGGNVPGATWSVYVYPDLQAFCRDVPDAFATADDDGDGMQGADRALTHQKSKKSQRDPSLQQAEQILAVGSDALMLHQ